MADDKLKAAATQLFILVHSYANPSGEEDDYGRWYPIKMLPCCEKIVQPERGNLYSFFLHQRTVKHIAMEFGVSPEALRGEVTEPDGVFFKAERNLMAAHTIEKVKESVNSRLEASEYIEKINTIKEDNDEQ